MQPDNYQLRVGSNSSLKLWKVVCSVCSIAVSLSILFAHDSNQLFPSIPIAFFIVAIGGGVLALNSSSKPTLLLSVISIIALTVVLRWYIYAFPASYIGFDPDKFAIWAESVVETGAIHEIGSSFYRGAPAFFLLVATSSIVADMTLRNAMGIYAILIGIIIPLLAFVFVKRAGIDNHRVLIGAVAIGSVLATSVKYGYWPIAQSLGILIFQIFILALILWASFPSMSNRIVVSVLIGSLVFVHKIPVFLSALLCITAIVWSHIRPTLIEILAQEGESFGGPKRLLVASSLLLVLFWVAIASIFTSPAFWISGALFGIGLMVLQYFSNNSILGTHTRSYISRAQLAWITAFSCTLLLVQWVFTSGFVSGFYFNYIRPFYDRGISSEFANPEYPGAIQVTPTILDPFFHQSHILLLLLGAAIMVFWLLLRDPDRVVFHESTMGVLLVLSPLSVSVLSSVGLGATRLFPNFGAVIAGVLSIGIFDHADGRIRSFVIGTVFIILILSQSFSAVTVPDYPNTYRAYLNNDEIAAKEFTYRHTSGRITTDYYYASEGIEGLPGTYTDKDTWFHGESDGYLSGTLLEKGHRYILFRDGLLAYRFAAPGNWKLTWDPQKGLQQGYSKPYDNGNTVLFWTSNQQL